jgi:hypothetical protein
VDALTAAALIVPALALALVLRATSRRPGRWNRYLTEGFWLQAIRWVSVLGAAAVMGSLIAGGGDLTGVLGVLTLATVGVAFSFYAKAKAFGPRDRGGGSPASDEERRTVGPGLAWRCTARRAPSVVTSYPAVRRPSATRRRRATRRQRERRRSRRRAATASRCRGCRRPPSLLRSRRRRAAARRSARAASRASRRSGSDRHRGCQVACCSACPPLLRLRSLTTHGRATGGNCDRRSTLEQRGLTSGATDTPPRASPARAETSVTRSTRARPHPSRAGRSGRGCRRRACRAGGRRGP